MLELPKRGFIFWPVGNGDSTTVVIDEKTLIQIDINHQDQAEDDDDPHAAIVDDLLEVLPEVEGRKYLAAFGLTHADEDHCRGFRRLVDTEDLVIGDLWFPPRILWEREELSDDAKAFCDEAERRIAANSAGPVGSGDRIRIIGDDEALEKFSELPAECFTRPGEWFSAIDGEDREGEFHAFVHAPFKEDAQRERNDTSIAIKLTLYDGDATGRAILFGDLHYDTLKRIFDEGDEDSLEWNVFLAPHHCSDSVMFVADEEGGEKMLRQDILDAFETAGTPPTYIVASSEEVPNSNDEGDNPPHARAKVEYEKICEDFECTGAWPNSSNPEPMVFEFVDNEFAPREPSVQKEKQPLLEALTAARGTSQTPGQRHGYGHRR